MSLRAALLLPLLLAAPALAQPATPAAAPPAATQAPKPAPLVVYFGLGSTQIRPQDQKTLDQASRLYREGHPIVMVLSGATDTTGSPAANLTISQQRAQSVLDALVARGIPAARFQLLAKGETDPAVPTPANTPSLSNRRVEITWR